LHSPAYSEQNSIHPIGARVVLPTVMNGGRSLAAQAGDITSAAANTAAPYPAPNIAAGLHFILWPLPVLGGHISHKRFEPPLSRVACFEENASKESIEYSDHWRPIRLKLEWFQFESNSAINARGVAST
jgi:hypothetical protein